MLILRSILFNLAFYLWTLFMVLLVAPVAAFLGERRMRRYSTWWMRGVHFLLAVLIGLRYRIVGRELLPEGPALIACKHQSAWETMIFHILVPDIAIALKYELTRIPLFGWYLKLNGCVRIDRGAAAQALRSLVRGAKARTERGSSFLIFPEGTRRPLDAPPDYKPGVAALYSGLRLPCVPVALNSGVFWGRRSFIKRPGTITLEILEPIPAGLDRKTFMRELESRIETASDRLVAEARAEIGEVP